MTTDLQKIRDSLKAYVNVPPDQPRTLDPFLYTSPELFELEVEHIWKKEWIMVGHVTELREPGDFFAYDILDEPMMFVLGEDRKIRALSTVCRHRFMPVVRDGSRGNVKNFQCPYHKWTYGLDGKLLQALYMEDNTAFDRSKIAMPEYRLEIWNGLIFVNLDLDAAPLTPKLAGLYDDFAVYHSDDGSFENPNPYDEVWAANWKLAVENGEAYHTMGVHSGSLEPYVPTQNIQPATHGEYWTKTVDLYATEREFTQEVLNQLNWKPGMYGRQEPSLDIYVVTPANGLACFPGGIGYQGQWPISVNRTRTIAGTATPPGVQIKASPEKLKDPMGPNRVYYEDQSAFDAGIGWGVKSSRLEAGLLSRFEQQVLHTHQWTARRILAAID